jgi:hypothetical protein
MSEEQLVSAKVQERLQASGLIEPGEVILAYANGQGAVPAWLQAATGVLLLPLIVKSFRGLALTERHIYVFDTKFAGAGAVKRVRAKYPIESVHASIGEPRRGWRTLQVEEHKIYVPNRGGSLNNAQAIAAAGIAPDDGNSETAAVSSG